MSDSKKSFWCKIGFHDGYVDSSFFNSVMRCNRPNCDWVDSETEAKDLADERKAWSQASAEGVEGFGNQILRVLEILSTEVDTMDKKG